MPQAVQAEVAALAAGLQDQSGEAARAVALDLRPSDFTTDERATIHTAIRYLVARREPVNVLSVCQELQQQGGSVAKIPATTIHNLEAAGPCASYVRQSIAYVRKAAYRRLLITAGQKLIEVARADDRDPSALLEDFWTATRSLDAAHDSRGIEPDLRRDGFNLLLSWPDGVCFELAAVRDTRDGIRGELTITRDERRLHWGAIVLSSAQARESLRKKLESAAPGSPWGDYLDESSWRLTQAARQGEPLVTLTGVIGSPTRELLPQFLFEGEPTLLYGDGDTGKSLAALAIAAAVQAGVALPFGLKPARAVPAAFLDWETSRDTAEGRLALISAGLGIVPPGILYKRMTRPLVDEAITLAADFARRGVGLVIVDSMMFAVAIAEGAAYHEPITSFYSALRLFAPAAVLVLSHVTGEDARRGGASRPFGGAFAFNGPRLVWEAKRDREVTDATAIAFTCTKANNLPRRPDPFGLLFKDLGTSCQVSPLDLAEAAPQIVASASLTYRIQLVRARGIEDPKQIADELEAKVETVKRVLRRLRKTHTGADNHQVVVP